MRQIIFTSICFGHSIKLSQYTPVTGDLYCLRFEGFYSPFSTAFTFSPCVCWEMCLFECVPAFVVVGLGGGDR